MNDLEDLPLFSGIPAIESPPRKCPRKSKHDPVVTLVPSSSLPVSNEPAAPPSFTGSEDDNPFLRITQAFIAWRTQNYQATLLLSLLRIIDINWGKMRAQVSLIENKLVQIKAAVARSIGRHDVCQIRALGGELAA